MTSANSRRAAFGAKQCQWQQDDELITDRQSAEFIPLAVSLGVDQKVSLQVHLKASNRSLATWWVCDQSQFVENSSAKVIGHHREPVVRAAQLQGHEERRELLFAGSHMILAKRVRGKDATIHPTHAVKWAAFNARLITWY